MDKPQRTLWAVQNEGWILSDFDVAEERARDGLRPGDTVTLVEYRPARYEDIDLDHYTDEVWDTLSELLTCDEAFLHDDGSALLRPSHFRPGVKERPYVWDTLQEALESVLTNHLDLDEAAWQETGRTATVHQAVTTPTQIHEPGEAP